MRALARLSLLTSLVLAGSCTTSGTFVLVTVEAVGGASPPGVRSVDLELTLGSKSAMTTLAEKTAIDIALPTTASLQVRSGSGSLTIVGIARDANGQEMGRGTGMGNVTSGSTTRITVSIDFSQAPLDMAMPGDLAGSDLTGNVGDDLFDAAGTPALLTIDHRPTYDFGTIVTGIPSATATFTVTNIGGAPSGTLGAAGLSGTGASAYSIMTDNCVGQTLAPNDSCTVLVILSSSTPGSPAATLTLTGSPGGSVSVDLTGTVVTPGAISISPSPVPFGSTLINTTKDVLVTVKNNGGSDTGMISFTFSGNDKNEFSLIAGGTCVANQTLTPNGFCTQKIHWAPTTGGVKVASVTVNATPGGPGVAILSATALTPAALSFTQASYSGGTVNAGSTSAIILTLQNTGTSDSGNLPANFASTISGSDFTFLAGGTCVAGAPLTGGNMCTIKVTFGPSSFGNKSGSISFTVNPGATPTPVSTNLTGVGQQMFTLTVNKAGSSTNGTGTIADSPQSGINCNVSNTDCTETYTVSTTAPTITLIGTGASGSPGSRFGAWSNNCAIVAGNCQITMDQNRTVSGSFIKLYSVTLTINGGGTGTVTSTTVPAQTNLNCTTGGACSALNFDEGTSVTLNESPASSSDFGSWTGSCTVGTGTCSFSSLATNQTVTASFNSGHVLTVTTITQTDGTAGTVTFSAGGVTNCSTTPCTASGLSGTVTITANTGSVLNGISAWGGDCSGTAAGSKVCSVDLTSADHTNITVTFAPYNIAFVSASTFTAALGSAGAYDTQCRTMAGTAGYAGANQFVAWISSSGNDAIARIKAPGVGTANANVRGWVRPDGNPFTDTLSGGLTNGVIYYPLRVTNTGTTLTTSTLVWTGTSATGVDSTSSDCTGWTGAGSSLSGEAMGGTGVWTGWNGAGCSGSQPIYCLGTKYTTPVRQVYTSGRRIFFANGSFKPGTAHTAGGTTFASHADADTICREYAAGGSPALCTDSTTTNCKFLAFMAAGGFSAIAFIANQTGSTWVRLDGVPIGTTGSDLWLSTHIAPITRSPSGAYSDFQVWAGATTPNGSPASTDNCSAWADGTAPKGYVGHSGQLTSFWFDWTNFGCNFSAGIYCVEDIP